MLSKPSSSHIITNLSRSSSIPRKIFAADTDATSCWNRRPRQTAARRPWRQRSPAAGRQLRSKLLQTTRHPNARRGTAAAQPLRGRRPPTSRAPIVRLPWASGLQSQATLWRSPTRLPTSRLSLHRLPPKRRTQPDRLGLRSVSWPSKTPRFPLLWTNMTLTGTTWPTSLQWQNTPMRSTTFCARERLNPWLPPTTCPAR